MIFVVCTPRGRVLAAFLDDLAAANWLRDSPRARLYLDLLVIPLTLPN